MNQPLISVLMTAYNREKYIGEAIESVLASDFPDFELIIMDDSSTDATLNIAQTYAEKDRRIKIFANEFNLGQFKNRNKAASFANGKYIKYLDSDDTIAPTGLGVMAAAMERYPDAGMAFCHTIGPSTHSFPFQISSKDAFVKHFFGGGLLFTGPSGLIMKKKAFDDVNGFEQFGMPSDNHLSLKLAAASHVVAIQPDLFTWRRHEEQVFSQNKKNYYNILDNFQFTKDIVLHHSPLDKRTNLKILNVQRRILIINLFKLSFTKKKPFLAAKIFINYLFRMSKNRNL